MASQREIEAAIRRQSSRRAWRTQRPYTVACPRCNAQPGKSCITPNGGPRAAHTERHDAADERLELF